MVHTGWGMKPAHTAIMTVCVCVYVGVCVRERETLNSLDFKFLA